MSAWDDVQTTPVDEIEAGVWKQMECRGSSDPAAPWADLAIALCQRIRAAEAERASLAALEDSARLCVFALAEKTAEADALRSVLREIETDTRWAEDMHRDDPKALRYALQMTRTRAGLALSSPESAPAPRRVPLVDNGRGQLVYAPTDEQAASADAFIRERLARAPAPESAETANSSSKEG